MIKKIVWSVDAFSENPQQEKYAIQLISALTKGSRVSVDPVFILSDIHIGETDYHGDARVIMKKLVAGAKLSGLKKPQVVARVNPPFSVRKLVKGLLAEAAEREADLIVTHTSNRKGIARFLLGSFAETLILSSRLPLLLINPRAQKVKKISHILFASDFCTQSFNAYKKVVEQASVIGACVTIYHRLTFPQHQYKEGHLELLVDRKLVDKWKSFAEDLGVDVSVSIGRKGDRVSDGIVKTAKRKKCDLIAMSSASGAVSSVLVGSAARQVIRTAEHPVWVLR